LTKITFNFRGKTLDQIHEEYQAMWEEHGIALPRSYYCKYCYKKTKPYIDTKCYSVIRCGVCHYGLAPSREVCEQGSLEAWRDSIEKAFNCTERN
jgi:hypothetical protein